MPWRFAILRGTRVLARCDATGAWVEDDGRVEIRYKPSDGRAYRAAARNLQAVGGEVLPDAHCVPGEAVADAKAGKAARGGAKAQKASAKDAVPPDTDHLPVVAYTDGACSGNPGPAGLGVVLRVGNVRRELSEYLGQATNNIAELTAILRAIEGVEPTSDPVVVHTDSQYAIGVLQKGWKAKANQELIEKLKARMRHFERLRLVYVKGHAGIPLNERADALARQAVQARHTAAWREVKIDGHAE
jgi:ribonuclease HI